MGNVGDDAHGTCNIILYCRNPSVVGGRCRAGVQIAVKLLISL